MYYYSAQVGALSTDEEPHLSLSPAKRMRTQQRHRLSPTQAHPIQKHFLYLAAPRRRGQTRARSSAVVPIPPTPTKCLPQVQGVVQRRSIHDGVRGRDPKIGPRYMGVPSRMQQGQIAVLAPHRLEAGVVRMVQIEAAVRSHGLDTPRIEIHKVVRGESHDAPHNLRRWKECTKAKHRSSRGSLEMQRKRKLSYIISIHCDTYVASSFIIVDAINQRRDVLHDGVVRHHRK